MWSVSILVIQEGGAKLAQAAETALVYGMFQSLLFRKGGLNTAKQKKEFILKEFQSLLFRKGGLNKLKEQFAWAEEGFQSLLFRKGGLNRYIYT